MEFDKTNFNPDDQGEIMSMQELLSQSDVPKEDIQPIIVDDEPQEVVQERVEISSENQAQEPAQVVEKQDSFFKTYVKNKIESGKWAEIEDFDDIDVDEETFDEIVSAQIEFHKQEATANTVKTDNLSPIMLKALEIDKNGGNISQVFETYKNIYENPENPISSLNLEDPVHQESLLRYFHKSKGLEDFEVDSIVAGHKKNLTLDKAAAKAKQDIDTVFNNYLEQQAAQAQENKAKQQEALKAYKSGLTEELKKYSINDNYRKTLVEKAAKPDEKGTYAVDAIYDEWRRNPEKAAKLLMFLTNEEEYIKTRAEKIIIQEKNDTFNKIKLASRKATGGTPEGAKAKTDSGVLSLAELQ